MLPCIKPLILFIVYIQIPPRFKHLHDKHKAIFDADVDAAMKNLAAGLKQMQSQRMSMLLIDVDAAMKEEAGPSVKFTSSHDVGSEEQDKAQEAEVLVAKAKVVGLDVEEQEKAQGAEVIDAKAKVVGVDVEDQLVATTKTGMHKHNSVIDLPQTAVILDSWTTVGDAGDRPAINSPVRSPEQSSPRRGISDEAWNNAPDAPSMDLFPEGSEEFIVFSNIPDRPSHKSIASMPIAADMSCVEKPPESCMFLFFFHFFFSIIVIFLVT
jgi:hypothetical protein